MNEDRHFRGKAKIHHALNEGKGVAVDIVGNVLQVGVDYIKEEAKGYIISESIGFVRKKLLNTNRIDV